MTLKISSAFDVIEILILLDLGLDRDQLETRLRISNLDRDSGIVSAMSGPEPFETYT